MKPSAATACDTFQGYARVSCLVLRGVERLYSGKEVAVYLRRPLFDIEIKNEALKLHVEEHADDARIAAEQIPRAGASTEAGARGGGEHQPDVAHRPDLRRARDKEPLTALAFAGIAAIAWTLTTLFQLAT